MLQQTKSDKNNSWATDWIVMQLEILSLSADVVKGIFLL